MKKIADMSQDDINALSIEDFDAIPPEEKRSCYDCGHLVSALSWWCGSDDAINYRGTSLPGCIKCTYWIPSVGVRDRVKSFFSCIWR